MQNKSMNYIPKMLVAALEPGSADVTVSVLDENGVPVEGIKSRTVNFQIENATPATKMNVKLRQKKLATLTGKTKTLKKVAGKKIKQGTNYKFIVVAIDKNKKVVSISKMIHVAAKSKKVGNYKGVKIKKATLKKAKKLKKNKSLKLKAKVILQSKKLKVKKHTGLRYESSNKSIATVSSKGVIKAKKKGTCYVYAYAQNGVFKKVKVVTH